MADPMTNLSSPSQAILIAALVCLAAKSNISRLFLLASILPWPVFIGRWDLIILSSESSLKKSCMLASLR